MLKPVSFSNYTRSFYRENKYAQSLLLKAVSKGVTDPEELKKIAGLRSVAEVYRTMDKMSIRKEYHAALAAAGLDLGKIVSEIKTLGEGAEKESVRLDAWKTLLKSIGLDKYQDQADAGKNWEETLLKVMEDRKALPHGKIHEGEIVGDYEVKVPEPPKSVVKSRRDDKEFSDSLYGKPDKPVAPAS